MKPKYLIIFALILLVTACKKNWLDERSSKSLVVPTTLQDFQLLLDNALIMNTGYPTLGEIATDNYYVSTTVWQALPLIDRNAYIWAPDVFQGNSPSDWSNPYRTVYYANTVLEGVEKIIPDASNQLLFNSVKGSALFFRAFSFYNIAEVFAKPYNSQTANTDLGIILRLSTDINVPSNRLTIQETYDQIISDLLEAKTLLPVNPMSPGYKTRPSKPAAFALLARVYLAMSNYDKALQYADSTLQLYNTLMNYAFEPNYINTGLANTIKIFNPEVIFHASMASYLITGPSRATVDSTLYQSYQTNDARRTVFFKPSGGRITYVGSYVGNALLFIGLAVDEMYLIRAECYVRKGSTTNAMTDLNTLLSKRWATGFVPLTATDANDALIKILKERRKELVFRLRWIDLRRLNKENSFAVSLTRNVNSQIYTLPPNDNRYVYPIPNSEILYSKVPQNPR